MAASSGYSIGTISLPTKYILQTESPIECKRLSYQINGMDREKWQNDGYEVCYDGTHEKFIQNPPLLAMLKVLKF